MTDKMNEPNFVHLHVHSYYSLLDGLSSPAKLVEAAVEHGYKALAITDHGSCGGLLSFQKACKEKGIKPILGNEMYITQDRNVKEKTTKTHHLVIIAKNAQGIKNLMQLTTLSEMQGKYRHARIDFSLLEKYHEGLICTSACSNGELPSLIWNDQNDAAEALALKYKALFGEDYYIEVMRHTYNGDNPQQKKEYDLSVKLYALGKKLGIKVIATNDAHYARRTDSKYHDVLLSIQTLDTIKNPDRFTFDSSEFYLKGYGEMAELFKDMPDVLSNTMEIAEKVQLDLLKKSEDLLPVFVVPEGIKDEKSYLKELVRDGMIVKKLINLPEYRERIRFEMELITRCGFVRYFLILWDVINYAKQKGIRYGAGRGSGVGSLCLYVLGITKLDPIKHGLLFERFINPERVSPPDVDMDFDYYRRDEIFEYVYQKYGRENCSKIGTYGTLKARAVIRSTAKALDLGKDWDAYQEAKKRNIGARPDDFKKSLDIADFLAKLIPKFPIDINLEMATKDSVDFRNAVLKYGDLLDYAMHCEKVVSSAGVHAAGIVACKDRISDHVPMRESKGQLCSQFTGPEVEELGLLKFDFLALKTLTVIDDTLKLIKQRHGLDIDIDNLEPNDQKVFKLFNGGYPNMDSRGIFQFESAKISQMVKNIRIDSFQDLVVCNALYRPGPIKAGVPDMYADFKHGRKEIVYLHPLMGSVLNKTYGCMVFQEDFMKVSQVLAKFTKGQSDTLRKIVGKKKPELIKKEHLDEKFIDGCVANGIDRDIAKKIFEQIEYFGGYGFNACLSGDTVVKNKVDGKYYRLDELENAFLEYGIEENFRKNELSFNGDKPANQKPDIVLESLKYGKLVEDKVLDVFETGEQELYEVELDNGMTVKCTMEHKFYCTDGKEHTLKEISYNEIEILYGNNKEQLVKCKIKSVKAIGKAKTYNLTMQGDQHNYAIWDMKAEKFVITKNSHSCAYSYIAFQTAWLKIYYPIEFMCNLLSSEIDNADKGLKLDSYLKEAKRMGLVVMGANINKSKLKFTIEGATSQITCQPIDIIRTPFTTLDGVGEVAAKAIAENQPYASLKEFLNKTTGNRINSNVFKSLVNTGAMDDVWNMRRAELVSRYEDVKDEISKEKVEKKKQKAYIEEQGDEQMLWLGGSGSELKL